ncbi:MAG: NADH:ubiquinone oxidoreductase, partial [Candidatus Diapherotrites archaeon]|nr:NADH:ubiquinone oxidoreductase [Candidatus Diapherotrites archaeon]
ALLVSALAMKAGSVPMHLWVPDAYSRAPAPITAMLVVASQTCLYALFRVSFSLFGAFFMIQLIGSAIVILGLLSMFIGVTMALPQKDIKRLMAYHAISQTGYMLLGVGLGLLAMNTSLATYGVKAMHGAIFHIINHAMYKGLLFLTAGAIIYTTGRRNLDELSGLARRMPLTAIFFIIGAAAIAGLPPTNGFASKLLIYESSYIFNPLLAVVAMIVSVLTLVSFVKVFCSAFLGPELKELSDARDVPKSMLLAMLLLCIFIIIFGLFPELIVRAIVEPAASALLNQNAYIGAVL